MGKAFPSRSVTSALRRYWWAAIAAFTTAIGASLLYALTAPSIYRTSARISVNDKTVSISDVGETLTDNTEIGGSDPIVTQAELVKSQGVLQRGLESYEAQSGDGDIPTVNELQSNIQVRIIPATTILELTYTSEDPDQASQILNAVIDAAVTENTEFIRQEASTLKTFLEGQIPDQAAQLAQAERAESEYRRANNLVSEGVQTQELVKSLAGLEQEERALRAALEESATRDDRLQQVTGVSALGTAYLAVQVGQDPELQTLQAQITELEVTLAEARSRLGDQHPDLLAILDQLNDLYNLYNERLFQLAPAS